MKILVTGGAGFIGSNFIRYWLKKYSDDEIVNLDKLTYAGHLSTTKDFSGNKNYKFIKGDICDSKIVDQAIEGTDMVVHFAAETHVDRSILSVHRYFWMLQSVIKLKDSIMFQPMKFSVRFPWSLPKNLTKVLCITPEAPILLQRPDQTTW